jgi:hypothetical protein
MHTLLRLAMVFSHLLLPAILLYGVARVRDRSRVRWIARVASASAYAGLIFVAGRWDWVGVPLRYVVPVALVGSIAWGARRVRELPIYVSGERWKLAGDVSGFVALGSLFVFSLTGMTYRGESVQLALPFRDGRFYVGQGGANIVLNRHRNVRAQQYALDIGALSGLGLHVSDLRAAELDHFVVFGAAVTSPCSGSVLEAVDGLPDQAITERDSKRPAGNHVILGCAGARVLLAHLQQGSVAVTKGRRVARGERIGAVGNSGNSTEPHLHLQATRVDADGVEYGVPMILSGRYAVRNTVFD